MYMYVAPFCMEYHAFHVDIVRQPVNVLPMPSRNPEQMQTCKAPYIWVIPCFGSWFYPIVLVVPQNKSVFRSGFPPLSTIRGHSPKVKGMNATLVT